MSFNRARFLIEVVGPEGAKTLAKAADRSSLLGQALIPRTIVAWLRANSSYDGDIPGAEGQHVAFAKSESGFSGSVVIQDKPYDFQNVSLFYVAGAIGVAVGMDSASVPKELKNLDLERLGKSIDCMVKVRRLSLAKAEEDKKPKKGKCPECGARSGGHFPRLVAGMVLKCKNDSSKLEKKAANDGSTGTQAAPIAPKAPEAPTAVAQQPTAQQISPLSAKKDAKPSKPVTPKVAKPPTVKVSKSEMGNSCPACSQKQFKDGHFVGCTCFRVLAKNVEVVSIGDEVELRLNGWDRASVLTLAETMGK